MSVPVCVGECVCIDTEEPYLCLQRNTFLSLEEEMNIIHSTVPDKAITLNLLYHEVLIYFQQPISCLMIAMFHYCSEKVFRIMYRLRFVIIISIICSIVSFFKTVA